MAVLRGVFTPSANWATWFGSYWPNTRYTGQLESLRELSIVQPTQLKKEMLKKKKKKNDDASVYEQFNNTFYALVVSPDKEF